MKRVKSGDLFDARYHWISEGTEEDEARVAEGMLEQLADWNDRCANSPNIFIAAKGEVLTQLEEILEQEPKEDRIRGGTLACNAHIAAQSFRISMASIEKGDAAEAARFAFDAGMAYQLMWLKHFFESDATRGLKSHRAASKGGGVRRDAQRARTSSILQEMQRLVDAGRTVSDAASAVARRGVGASPTANRALWYRRRKNM